MNMCSSFACELVSVPTLKHTSVADDNGVLDKKTNDPMFHIDINLEGL
jgi:hypothetical protein